MTIEVFRRLADAEQRVVQPFRLDCADLPDRARLTVRIEYLTAATKAVQLTANALGRIPDGRECQLLRAALTRHFNVTVIPTVREREAAAIREAS